MYKPNRAIFMFLTLALFLGGCLPATQPSEAPQVQNTPALIDVQSQINTSVAQTVAAQGQVATFVAQTMEAQATPLPSATPIPTFTPFTLATVTNTPWAGGGAGGSSGGGSGSTTNDGPYDCSVVGQKPYDGDRIWRPGDSFDVEWTLKNTGTKKIPVDAAFVYIGGENMSPTPDFLLGYEVDKQEKFALRIEVIAPQVTGTDKKQFTMQWALVVSGVKICRPYISIFVQKQ